MTPYHLVLIRQRSAGFVLRCFDCEWIFTVPNLTVAGAAKAAHVRETGAVILAEVTDWVMDRIDEEIASGRIPKLTGTFGQLHDHVDANEFLIHAGEHFGFDAVAELDLCNAVTDECDALLRARCPLPLTEDGFVDWQAMADYLTSHGVPAEFNSTGGNCWGISVDLDRWYPATNETSYLLEVIEADVLTRQDLPGCIEVLTATVSNRFLGTEQIKLLDGKCYVETSDITPKGLLSLVRGTITLVPTEPAVADPAPYITLVDDGNGPAIVVHRDEPAAIASVRQFIRDVLDKQVPDEDLIVEIQRRLLDGNIDAAINLLAERLDWLSIRIEPAMLDTGLTFTQPERNH